MNTPRPASAHTTAHNASACTHLHFDDRSDFERASRGLLARVDDLVIDGPLGRPMWDMPSFDFLHDECPPTVNPSLWRQAQLNHHHGLFEVMDGIYQVRGHDISNITFIRSENGWIVIDPLTVAETAASARALVDQYFGERPVRAVIYTHSHGDHFGGVRAIITDDEVRSGEVVVIAPDGFLEAAVSENVIAGTAMRRRAMYMYGLLLPAGPDAHVDCGLGKRIPFGNAGLIAPTIDITHTGQTLDVDGVTIEFQLTPGTEAPAEMNFYFPQFRALCMAENCAAVMHNLYTPRGAEVRDSLGWSIFIQESIERFLDRTDIAFASHHWPRWGSADIERWLGGQRDLYRYLHDETMRLANHGLNAADIAEQMDLPARFGDEWFNRGYYGTVNHNVKAVHQRYLGWFDGNPANLHPHPPVAQAQRIVRYMGGSAAMLEKARVDFEAGDYRWVAQVCNWLVFADPTDTAARELGADALEQMGYQTESSVWRGFFLMGAQELRQGTPPLKGLRAAAGPDVLKALTPQMVLDLCGVKLHGPRAVAANARFLFDIEFAEGLSTRMLVRDGVVVHTQRRVGETGGDAQAIIRTTAEAFVRIANELSTLDAEITAGTITIDGDRAAVEQYFGLLDQFELFFPIIEPRPAGTPLP